MATTLFSPILNDKTRAPHFFNGRLLSGEAMTDEQRAQRVARELLAEAVGDGIVYGLTVDQKPGSDITSPVVTVKSGVAINRCGEILLLANDTDVQLVPPAHVATPPATIFGLCKPPIADASCSSDFQALQPPQSGTYVADDGVYLLTICSIGAGEGLATVSGLGNTPGGCNIKYAVDAVEFRLLELPVDPTVRADTAHLRNWVAYQCFGADDLLDFATDPFGANADAEPHTLLDDIRPAQLTDCDVPLGVMYWTATGGIQFLDLWSVRRRVAHMRVASPDQPLSDRRLACGEAMLLQFQEQIDDLRASGVNLSGVVASQQYSYLPPVGIVPAAGGSPGAFVYATFFADFPPLPPVYMECSRLQSLVRDAVQFPPIKVGSNEFVRLYVLRENRQAIDGGSTSVKPALVFANGHVWNRSDPHYDLSHWDYANYW